ncbi:serine-aspartate repeat-containing protein F-like isoform X2 [Ptychodera flava]
MAIAGIIAGGIAGLCLLGFLVKLILNILARKFKAKRPYSHLDDGPGKVVWLTNGTTNEAMDLTEVEPSMPISTDNVSHTTDSYTDVRIEQEGPLDDDDDDDQEEEEENQLTTFVDINHSDQVSNEDNRLVNQSDSVAMDGENAEDDSSLPTTGTNNMATGSPEIEPPMPTSTDDVSHTTDSVTDVRIEQEVENQLTTFVGINNSDQVSDEDNRDDEVDDTTISQTIDVKDDAPNQNVMETDDGQVTTGNGIEGDRVSDTTDSETDRAADQESATDWTSGRTPVGYSVSKDSNDMTAAEGDVEHDGASRTTDSEADIRLGQSEEPTLDETDGVVTPEASPTTDSEADIRLGQSEEPTSNETDVVVTPEASRTTDSEADSRIELEEPVIAETNGIIESEMPDAGDDGGSRTTDSETDGKIEQIEQSTIDENDGITRQGSYDVSNHDNVDYSDEEAPVDIDDESYTTDSDTDTKVKLETTLAKQQSQAVNDGAMYDNEIASADTEGQPIELLEDTERNRAISGLENFSYSQKVEGDNQNFEMRGGFQDLSSATLTTQL